TKAHRALHEVPGQPEGRTAVAEVSLDLARDRRYREAGELGAALRIEPVDRLDQSDRAHLNEILERLSRSRVTARDRADEREVQGNQPVAGIRIARLLVPAEQDIRLPRVRRSRSWQIRRHTPHCPPSIVTSISEIIQLRVFVHIAESNSAVERCD